MNKSYDPETKIWSSKDGPSIFNPKSSLGEILLYALRRTPDKVCEISDDYKSFSTCHEVQKRSIQVAESLKNDYGIKFGDICAVVSKNNPEVSSVVFGCIFNGCPVNTLDPSFAQIDFDHMLGLTRPKVIFAESSVIDKIQNSIKKLGIETKIFCFTNVDGVCTKGITPVKVFYEKSLDFPIDDYFPANIQNTTKHIALIMCSSGTTGLSKGVCLPHSQVIALLTRFWPVDFNSTSFAFSSLYWITGYFCLLTGTIQGAMRVITTKPASAEYFFELIEKHRITHCFVPPSMISQCLESTAIKNADLSSLQRCYTGGSLVLEELRVEFQKYLDKNGKVIACYGMSEVASVVTFNENSKNGSVGTPVNMTQIKIMSEDGEALCPGEKGEIFMRQPYSFVGYYGNEEAFKDILDAEGWIHSGDLGYFDKEGYLYIDGRKKEMIKYKGYQISPGTLETIIQESTGLTQICAVAIEEHKQGTDLPAVVIVLQKDCKTPPEEIIKTIDEQLDDVKKLRGGVYFVEKFPMTPSGKILRREVKEMANKLYNERKFAQTG